MPEPAKTVSFRTVVAADRESVWQLHSNVENIVRISPPFPRVSVHGEDRQVFEGALHKLTISFLLFRIRWHARISGVVYATEFTDTAEKSPFEYWRHTHRFESVSNGSAITDEVEYVFRSGVLGALVGWIVDLQVRAMFRARARIYLREFGPPESPEDVGTG